MPYVLGLEGPPDAPTSSGPSWVVYALFGGAAAAGLLFGLVKRGKRAPLSGRRARRGRGLGSSDEVHTREGRKAFLHALDMAKRVSDHVDAYRCKSALMALASMQEARGEAIAHNRSGGKHAPIGMSRELTEAFHHFQDECMR